MSTPFALGERAEQLRREFDGAFALPPTKAAEDGEDVLAIRCGEAYALRRREVGGLVADRRIVRIPSGNADLLGLAGVRGVVVPVFALGALLGQAGDAGPVRWIAIVDADCPVGLGFERLEGTLRAPKESFAPAAGGAPSHVAETVRFEGLLRGVVSVASVVNALKARARVRVAPEDR